MTGSCACGCPQPLTGRQSRWATDACRKRFQRGQAAGTFWARLPRRRPFRLWRTQRDAAPATQPVSADASRTEVAT